MTGAARLARAPAFHVVLVSVSAIAWFVIGAALLSQFPLVFHLVPGAVEETTADIAELVELMEAIPADARPLAARAFSSPTRDARLADGFPDRSDDDQSMVRMLRGARPGSLLSAREMQVRRVEYRELLPRSREADGLRVFALAANELSIRLKDGEVLVIWISPLGLVGGRGLPMLAIAVLALLVFSVAGTLGFRYALGSLRKLEASAAGFQPGRGASVVEEAGPSQVRQLTKALNAMQLRIDQLTRERSFLVAGVAHDIRTHITRMRLRIDQLRSPKKAALETDLSRTEQLLDDLMVYARADRHDGVAELIDLGELLDALAAEQAFDLPRSGCGAGFVIAADRAALERAFSNLISNAWKYGEAARVRCRRDGAGFEVSIEDDGPGIPEGHLHRVMDPFYRVEPSRNPDTGGTGLGLTIARDLLSAQGAALRLENRLEGGLRAVVTFPPESRID
ncbi:HAMP domain-containing histidine kinase [Marinicauda algicola]|uniref:histidine kinase n=1 Tax=Marinicauda algicola TaxID=2029849 RepID=A0A4S2H1N4_9PROT|nr:HAMP domain-containing sensor histidine kinase [Marinicauda algicola]TGY89333.1 HAMP domain-containing histidine kinase [Marinicauda algicola]